MALTRQSRDPKDPPDLIIDVLLKLFMFMHVYIHYMCNYIEKDTSRSIPLSLVKLEIGIISGNSANPLGLELCKRQTISILPPAPFSADCSVYVSPEN